MAHEGNFGGFEFDPEVFTDYVNEQDTWSTPVIESGALVEDASVMNAIGEKGNIASVPFYKPLNAYEDGMEALNNDGTNNNTPVETVGGKQTMMLVQRMKAFKAQDFTKELTGADPLGNIAAKVAGYYNQVYEQIILGEAKAVVGVTGLESHTLDLTGGDLITPGMIYDGAQAALGDMASQMGLIVMHSKIYAEFLKADMVEFEKYTNGNIIRDEITLPTIAGKRVLVTDYGTVDGEEYDTYLLGEGAFIGAVKGNYSNPYYTAYDPETQAGIETLYTKQGRVIHPNGLSLNVDGIAAESPTNEELFNSDNWTLKYDPKNVRIGVIKTGVANA